MDATYKRKHAPVFVRLMQRTEQTETCWLWQGYCQPSGHGQIGDNSNGKKGVKACHRVMWETLFGPVDDGLCVLHKCDVPNCVNPDHLFLGTRTDNSNDKVAKGRVPRGMQLPHTKLSDETVQWIRKNPLGISQAAMGRMVGVAQSHICGIVNGNKRARA